MVGVGVAVLRGLALLEINYQGVLLGVGDAIGLGLVLVELSGPLVALLLLDPEELGNGVADPPDAQWTPRVYKLHKQLNYMNHVTH